jgi:predicted CXXCH cytochrome family protein
MLLFLNPERRMTMKKIIASTIFLALACSTAYSASITVSKHNLSTTGSGSVHSTTQTNICIFCHTPHTPMGGPLWNRLAPVIDPATYTLYTASETLTTAAKTGKIGASSPSTLCMTCHGGTLADIGARVYNSAGNPMTMVDTNGTWPKSGVLWDGTSPVNHPVGFSYSLAQAQNPANLRSVTLVNASFGYSPFYSSAATGTLYQDSMECETCHTVHDPANTPFLRIGNSANALCLSCHIKYAP